MSQMSKAARKYRKYTDRNDDFQAGKRNFRERAEAEFPTAYPDDEERDLELHWQTGRPPKDGYYWTRCTSPKSQFRKPTPMYVIAEVWIEENWQWAGPLEPPKEGYDTLL